MSVYVPTRFDFRLHDEIGRSSRSQVYKGRRRNTIEYYAVKSVDKKRRSRVSRQVRYYRGYVNTTYRLHMPVSTLREKTKDFGIVSQWDSTYVKDLIQELPQEDHKLNCFGMGLKSF